MLCIFVCFVRNINLFKFLRVFCYFSHLFSANLTLYLPSPICLKVGQHTAASTLSSLTSGTTFEKIFRNVCYKYEIIQNVKGYLNIDIIIQNKLYKTLHYIQPTETVEDKAELESHQYNSNFSKPNAILIKEQNVIYLFPFLP